MDPNLVPTEIHTETSKPSDEFAELKAMLKELKAAVYELRAIMVERNAEDQAAVERALEAIPSLKPAYEKLVAEQQKARTVH